MINLNVLAGDTGTVKVSCTGKTLDLSLLNLYKANFTVNGKDSSYEMASKISSGSSNYYFAYAGLTKRKIDTIVEGKEFVVLINSNSSLDNSVYSSLATNIANTFKNSAGIGLSLDAFKKAIVSGISKVKSSDLQILFSGVGDSADGVKFNGLVTSEGGIVDNSATDSAKVLAADYFKEGETALPVHWLRGLIFRKIWLKQARISLKKPVMILN